MKSFFRNISGVLLLIMMVSCKTYHPLNEHNYFNGSILYNDPLNIRFKYFGDIEFEELRRTDRKKIKRTIKGIEGVIYKKYEQKKPLSDIIPYSRYYVS